MSADCRSLLGSVAAMTDLLAMLAPSGQSERQAAQAHWVSLAAPHSPVFVVPGLLNSLRLEHLSNQAHPYRLFPHPVASAFPRIQVFRTGLLWVLWGVFAQVALQKSRRLAIPGVTAS